MVDRTLLGVVLQHDSIKSATRVIDEINMIVSHQLAPRGARASGNARRVLYRPFKIVTPDARRRYG